MDKEKLNWRSIMDHGVSQQWNTLGTPTSYVLDVNGVIRHKWFGSPGDKVLDAALERLIQEAEKERKSR